MREFRRNTDDPATGTITVSAARGRAYDANAAHYADVFSNGREHYAMPRGTVSDPERLLGFSIWAINGGLLAMVLLSLLPVGLLQTWASVDVGYWYARSSGFMPTPVMQTLRWARVHGDTAFAAGAVAFVAAIVRVTMLPARNDPPGVSTKSVGLP